MIIFSSISKKWKQLWHENSWALKLCVFLLLWIWASFGRAWTQFDLFYMTMKIDLSMIFVMRRFTFLVFIIIWSSLYVLLLLLCVLHHYHVSFSWSIFIIPWFRVWAKDPSFLTTIKYDAFLFFFLCYYRIFCEVQLRCATEKNPPEDKKTE